MRRVLQSASPVLVALAALLAVAVGVSVVVWQAPVVQAAIFGGD